MTTKASRVTYILILHLPRQHSISVGGLGKITFEPGIYFYIGSGGRSPAKRIARHVRRRKRKFWHIDYLTVHSQVIGVITMESGKSLECALATAMAETFPMVEGFGSSDCPCRSHLFYGGLSRGGKT